MSNKIRVLILGGGFGGLYAALQFEKRNDERFEITVVNRENFFLFTPMLHEIAASDLDLTNIVNPVRKMIRRVNFFLRRGGQYRHREQASGGLARLPSTLTYARI